MWGKLSEDHFLFFCHWRVAIPCQGAKPEAYTFSTPAAQLFGCRLLHLGFKKYVKTYHYTICNNAAEVHGAISLVLQWWSPSTKLFCTAIHTRCGSLEVNSFIKEKNLSATEKVHYLSCTHTWTVPFYSQKHFYVVAAANRLKRFQTMSVKLA